MPKNIENVEVSLNEETFAVDCLAWTADGFQFHIWSNAPTLYKNPPEGAEYGKPGYFETRHLDATARTNAQMISDARTIASVQGAAEKAKAALLQKKAEKDEANRISYAKHCKREAAEEMYDALCALLNSTDYCDDERPLMQALRAARAKATPAEKEGK